MPEPHRQRAVAGAVACALLLGCASAPLPDEDLAPILPNSESELLTAPPAARDALEAGLHWIVRDAPGTTSATSDRPAPTSSSEQSSKAVAALPAALRMEAPAGAPAREAMPRGQSAEGFVAQMAPGARWMLRAWPGEGFEPRAPEGPPDARSASGPDVAKGDEP